MEPRLDKLTLEENIRFCRVALADEQQWANKDHVAALIARQQSIIDEAQAKIDEFRQHHADSGRRAESAQRDLDRAIRAHREYAHRHEIERLQRLVAALDAARPSAVPTTTEEVAV